jgi:hypothetical protein
LSWSLIGVNRSWLIALQLSRLCVDAIGRSGEARPDAVVGRVRPSRLIT